MSSADIEARAEGPIVHHSEDGWWFWEETWADRQGPFASEVEARAAFHAYCKKLGLDRV